MSRTEDFGLSCLVRGFAVAILVVGILVGLEPATLGVLVAVSGVVGLPFAKWLRGK